MKTGNEHRNQEHREQDKGKNNKKNITTEHKPDSSMFFNIRPTFKVILNELNFNFIITNVYLQNIFKYTF